MNDFLSCVILCSKKGLLPAETAVTKYMNKNLVAIAISLQKFGNRLFETYTQICRN